MVPLRMVYFYSIISMGFSGSTFVSGVSRLYRTHNLHLDTTTVLTFLAILINIAMNIAAIWAYRLKHVKWTFWISTVYVLFSLPYSHLVMCQFQACGEHNAKFNEENRKKYGLPKWGYPIALTLLVSVGATLYLVRTLWLTAFAAHHRLPPKLWRWIEKHHKGIRKNWYLHVVTVLVRPNSLDQLNKSEIQNFVQSGKRFANAEDVTFTTLSLLLITALSSVGLSNVFFYIGLRQGRPVFLHIFILSKGISATVCISIVFGMRQAYREISWSLVAATNATLLAELSFAYFYKVKLIEGWEDQGANKTAWNLPIVPLKALTGIQTEPLGQGNTSTVYQCLIAQPKATWFSKTKRLPAAMKHFQIQDPDQICHEFSNLHRISRLKHGNVVRFYGICVEEQMISAIFELCDQGSLKGYLEGLGKETKSKQWTSHLLLQQLTIWSEEVATGMEFLANNGVIHGDLAARNVLLSPNLTAKISDFGLSHKLYGTRVYERLDQSMCLPWKWMAPEILIDRATQKGSDVWSYGISLWEIFSLGEEPWQAYQYDSRFSTVLQKGVRPERPKYASQIFYDKCMMPCWELGPCKRPSFQLLRDEVHQIYNQERDVPYKGEKSVPYKVESKTCNLYIST